MAIRFIAIVLAAILSAAAVLSLSSPSSSGETQRLQTVAAGGLNAASANTNDPATMNDAFVGDFKSGYADGFNAGVTGLSYPDQSSMASNARGYLDGFNQGYTDGQSQQANLRNKLCGAEAVGSNYQQESHSNSRRSVSSSRVLGDRAYNARREDNGLSSTTRKWLLIGGGTAAGAGLGGAFGGRKGALIGALVGGGTGTALALNNKPSRAFNRRVSTKSVLKKSLIGAGAGTVIGALAGGKRGALAGAALGGGGGLIWSLLNGRRSNRR